MPSVLRGDVPIVVVHISLHMPVRTPLRRVRWGTGRGARSALDRISV
jgi:hypothetical protein